MKVTEDWCDVLPGAGTGKKAGSRVLYILEFVDDFGGGAIKETIAVIKPG